MISASDLIRKFQEALDGRWGYIYGKTHEMWSKEKQAAYARENSDDPDRANSVKYGGKWAGHWVTDCSGLFRWAYSCFGCYIAHGSNSIWDKYCSSKGQLKSGDRLDGKELKPGTAVFTSTVERHNHIGLYTGGGLVIEAQGAQAGVVTSLVTNKKWTHWGELKGVSYDHEGDKMMMAATVVLPSGKSGSTVNLREGPGTSYHIVERVPVGHVVCIEEDRGSWCKVSYKDKTGWMQSNYLEYSDQTDETDHGVDGADQQQIDAMLRLIEDATDAIAKAAAQIEDATDKIGSIIGRG